MMYVGKIIGRGISDQQAYLREKFPAVSTNSGTNQVSEVSGQEQAELSAQSMRLIILVAISSVAVTIVFIITKRLARAEVA